MVFANFSSEREVLPHQLLALSYFTRNLLIPVLCSERHRYPPEVVPSLKFPHFCDVLCSATYALSWGARG